MVRQVRSITAAERALISLVWDFREADKKLRAYAQENANPELLKLIDEYVTSPLFVPAFDGIEEVMMEVWGVDREKRDKAVAKILESLGMKP